jgi:spermidine synthase
MKAMAKKHLQAWNELGAPNWLIRVLFVCFFLSGAAGLIYQVLWIKALGLIFGKTTYAVTAVLAAFMAGLALGSWFWGRYAERTSNPLRLYGWIELGIALTGLASLVGLWATRGLYSQFYEPLANQPALLLACRFLASFLVLLIPTTLMGGTYPVVLKYLTRRRQQLGIIASRLYWLNTAGAITGACLAGFVLLWHLGLLRTLVAAASLNLTVAGLVLFSLRRIAGVAGFPPAGETVVRSVPAEPLAPAGARLVLLVSGISGLTAMMFEIGWTRILAVFLSSTTHAFTLMLATILFGITLGSYLFERWHPRWELSHKLLGQLLTLLALGGVLFLAISTKLPEMVLELTRASGESGAALLGTQFLACFVAMILPATVFGLIFPLTVVLYCGEDRRRGARAGALYAVNTLGAILGAFLTGLFLVQWIGTVQVLLLGSGLNAAVALSLFVGPNPQRRWGRAALAGALLVLLLGAAAADTFALPLFHARTVVANIFRDEFQRRLTVDEIIGLDKLIFLEEGVNSTVVVARREGYTSLRTDGKTEASTGGADRHTQLLSAYLPLALHPHPRRVLVVGFGSGATVHAVAQFSGVERVDCVEIEPAVLEAAPYLEELNRGVYTHAKVRVILDDARNYLMATGERYDVIISEPSYLWSAGVANLFTQEFYRQARQHLEPQGLFMQWVQAYQLAPRDLRTVLRTLSTSFDQLSLWRGSYADFLLLSSPAPRSFQLRTFEQEVQRNPPLRADLATYLGIHEPAGLVGYYLLDDAALRELAKQADVNTDDRNVLEYRAPFSVTKKTDELNHALVRRLRQEALPAFVELDDPGRALLAGAETQLRMGMLDHPLGAGLVPDALRQDPDSPRTLMIRALVNVGNDRFVPALDHLQRAEKAAPDNPQVSFYLGRLYIRQGQDELARQALERCLRLSPRDGEALGSLRDLEARARRWERAIELQQRLIAAQPPQLYAEWARLGELYLSIGETGAAVEALRASLELEPLGYVAHRHAAKLLAHAGEVQKAIGEYRFLIQYYPTFDAELYLELAGLYQKIGNPSAARQTLEKARRIFPAHAEVERALWETGSS